MRTKKLKTGVKPEEVLSYDPDTRIARMSLHGLPSVGLPNWKYDKINRYGQTVRRRFFGSDSKPILDIDFNDHGHPNAHPMGAHAHDNGLKNRSHLRELKDWERKIVQEIQAQENKAVSKSTKDTCQFISGRWADITDVHITIEQYKRIMDIGGEYGFVYDGHGYFTSGFGHLEAWEWNNDESYREGFKDIDDMLDNYHVHTGETLREILPKSTLEDSPVWPV